MIIDAFLCRQFLHACTPSRDLYFPYGRIAFLRSLLRWHREAKKKSRQEIGDRSPFTVILQSYKRPWNIEPMAKLLLRFDSVERVIVSNNNPDVHLRLHIDDPRLQVINQPHRYPASLFALLALHEAQKGAQYFLTIDDDLLLFPDQIEALMHSLTHDPAAVHGVVGQILADDGRVLAQHLTGQSAVDVLNRAYAFTADHIRRYVEILEQLGYETEEQKAQLRFGSDIVLSASGKRKPCIHDVGRLLSCPSAAQKGTARFREKGFGSFRMQLWQKIRAQ
jgi:hypothetical protein